MSERISFSEVLASIVGVVIFGGGIGLVARSRVNEGDPLFAIVIATVGLYVVLSFAGHLGSKR